MYASLPMLRDYLGVSVVTDDALLELSINRAQAAINAYCKRQFEATTETRYYFADAASDLRDSITTIIPFPDYHRLRLDKPLLTATTVTNGDGTVIASSSYFLWPFNATRFTSILLKAGLRWVAALDQRISIAGTWGWSATADGVIQQACLRWAAYMYRQKDAQVFDTTAEIGAGIITVPQGIPRDVQMLLKPYREYVFA